MKTERSRGGNAILVELMLAILFFMLCACVLVRLFAGAALVSREAKLKNTALVLTQDVADAVYCAQDVEQTLTELGFAQEDGVWQKQDGTLTLCVECRAEDTDTGVLRRGTVSAWKDDEALLTLPCTRYLPQE